jgi:hypothetical protein
LTIVAAISVNAVGVYVTFGRLVQTFINIVTAKTVSGESAHTLTSKWSFSILTVGVCGAGVRTIDTFIVIDAIETISKVSGITDTAETAWKITTGGIGVTVVQLFQTFIDISTDKPVSLITIVTRTWKWTSGVYTSGIGRAWVVGAFIDIITGVTITSKASVTVTLVGTRSVGTCGVGGAGMAANGAFVNLGTNKAVSRVSRKAWALESTNFIGTDGIFSTRIAITFVNVITGLSIATESVFTRTVEWTFDIGTNGIDVTVVGLGRCTFVTILTGKSITAETFGTAAAVAAIGVGTFTMCVTFMRTFCALIDFHTCKSITTVSVVTLTEVTTDGITTTSIAVAAVVNITLVDVLTVSTNHITRWNIHKSRFAWTFIVPISVDTVCIGRTFVNYSTFIDVLAITSITGKAITAIAGVRSKIIGTGGSRVTFILAITFINVGTSSTAVFIETVVTCACEWTVGVITCRKHWACISCITFINILTWKAIAFKPIMTDTFILTWGISTHG